MQANALTLPALIPVEVLLEVFLNLNPFRPFLRASHQLVTATHVCSYWRHIALRSPGLWYHIELKRKPEYIRMLLKRSCDHSLYISGSMRVLDIPTLQMVLAETHRMRCIAIYRPPYFTSVVDELQREPMAAPRLLEYFEGYMDDIPQEHNAFYERSDRHDFSLLSILDSPNLRLASLGAMWGSGWTRLNALPSLTSLTINENENISIPRNGDISPILEALGSLPLLQMLHMETSLHKPTFRLPLPIPTRVMTVTLARLLALKLTGDWSLPVSVQLLQGIQIPDSAEVVVCASWMPTPAGNGDMRSPAPQMLDMIRDVINKVAARNISCPGVLTTLALQAWQLDMDGTIGINFHGCVHSRQVACRHPCLDVFSSCHISIHLDSYTPIPVWLSHHIKVLDCPEVSVEFSPDVEFASAVTLDCFRQFAQVEKLTLNRFSVAEISRWLGDGSDAVTFPRLQELRLVDCSLSRPCETHGSDNERASCETCRSVEELIQVFRYRAQLQAPLRRLGIKTLMDLALTSAQKSEFMKVIPEYYTIM